MYNMHVPYSLDQTVFSISRRSWIVAAPSDVQNKISYPSQILAMANIWVARAHMNKPHNLITNKPKTGKKTSREFKLRLAVF